MHLREFSLSMSGTSTAAISAVVSLEMPACVKIAGRQRSSNGTVACQVMCNGRWCEDAIQRFLHSEQLQ